MTFARNLITAARRPALAAEYVNWLMQLALRRGRPVRALHGRVKLGSFANFSEFHSVDNFLNDQEVRFLSNYPFGDGPLLDVGANVGLVSLLLAQRYPERTVHAFEPNPSTYVTLTDNVALNGAARVCCHEMAVADRTGSLLFDADPNARGTAGIALEPAQYSTSVASVTLDDFCVSNGIDRIGFLKVDVEGYETLVFRGAERVLGEIRPAIIYFEVCPVLADRAGFDSLEPARLLMKDHGYNLKRWNSRWEMVDAVLDDVKRVKLENWIALRP
jgi:FkbM family methyltransferase